ncbi:phage-like element pbsx protein XkdM [Alkaliphilus metalliredigens QYMF]|uniref:Phage-like element pbsx protein XkdM n=1 Tax=Alkaliphilus metalliredigens (strain QYMF) TaxID=293826 RepID=A6TQV7_ALKMQ|nr:phage tail tube protein [Alkaliphilus metalliredigens]ABR48575.1 phage-like element pbsx protein XkdM [Alkaliphilus metalliredigens QYMF]
MGKSKIPSNKQINGTFGALWLDGEKLADVDSFESKININYEDVNMAEDLATHKKMTGWAGEGTLALKKVYSTGASLIGQKLKEGIMPVFTMVSKLQDPDAYGAERVSMEEVTFNEFTLAKFAQKELQTEELPFAFADFELIDLIGRR